MKYCLGTKGGSSHEHHNLFAWIPTVVPVLVNVVGGLWVRESPTEKSCCAIGTSMHSSVNERYGPTCIYIVLVRTSLPCPQLRASLA